MKNAYPVSLVTPMNRGLKDYDRDQYSLDVFLVSLVTPMNRGLKVGVFVRLDVIPF